MSRRFRLVDVFGTRSLTGNPLAVVVDSVGLDTAEMLEITRWLNFSETTFLLPPTDPAADYLVRIFTATGELPFAGHPTLGTCHVWRSLQEDPPAEVIQECGVGLVSLQVDDGSISFSAPPLVRDGPIDPDHLTQLVQILGIEADSIVDSAWVDNGPGWVGLLLEDAELVLSLKPDVSKHAGEVPLAIGVVGFWPDGADTRYEVRAFFSNQHGVLGEDPVTGSLNASLAQWLVGVGRVQPPYVASQGSALGRSGRVHISRTEDGRLWIGGRVFDVVTGEI